MVLFQASGSQVKQTQLEYFINRHINFLHLVSIQSTGVEGQILPIATVSPAPFVVDWFSDRRFAGTPSTKLAGRIRANSNIGCWR